MTRPKFDKWLSRIHKINETAREKQKAKLLKDARVVNPNETPPMSAIAHSFLLRWGSLPDGYTKDVTMLGNGKPILGYLYIFKHFLRIHKITAHENAALVYVTPVPSTQVPDHEVIVHTLTSETPSPNSRLDHPLFTIPNSKKKYTYVDSYFDERENMVCVVGFAHK